VHNLKIPEDMLDRSKAFVLNKQFPIKNNLLLIYPQFVTPFLVE
jgi:hypothetical protein